MVKKTLLSLAIAASTAGLTACNISSTSDNNTVNQDPVNAGKPGTTPASTSPIFSAGNSQLPLINDLIFANASVTDGTASLGDSLPPVTTALNSISGASIVAPIDIAFNGDLDPATLNQPLSVVLIKLRDAQDDPRIDALDLAGSIVPVANELWGGSPIDNEDQPGLGDDYTVSFLGLDDGKTPVLRINLINPLQPKSKYIVALTNGIKDTDGKAITESAEYNLLTGDLGLASSALAPVREALKGWEQIAGGYLTALGKSQDDIVLTYAFTTGGTTDVLQSVAAPQIFVEKLASNPSTAETLYLGALAGQLGTPEAAQTAWLTAIVSPIVAADENLTIADAAAPTTAELDAVRATDAYKAAIVAAASDNAVIMGTTAQLRTPTARPFKVIPGVSLTTAQAMTAFEPDGTTPKDIGIDFYQGQIELPVGLSAPTLTNAAALASGDPTTIAGAVSLSYAQDDVWAADDALNPPSDDKKLDLTAGKLSSTGVTAEKDSEGEVTGYTGGMTNVTYRYPLAEFDKTEYAPVLITAPEREDNTGQGGPDCSVYTATSTRLPVLIYVHGITSDRTSSVGIGTGMAANGGCYVTLAMDLPLHGVAPISNDRDGVAGNNTALAFNVEQATSPFGAAANAAGADFENLEERHRNVASMAGTNARIAMDFDGTFDSNGTDGTPSAGTSGAFFINLGNMGRLRDNMRQGVVDLLHLNATIATIDIDGDGTPDLDKDKVFIAGNSLGAIIATTFVAVNNSADVQAKNGANLPLIQGAVLASPGGSLPKMLENSPSFATNILGGLQFTQGADSLQKYESVMQAALGSVDPINFAESLRTDTTPVMMYNMIGGGACSSFDLATGVCGDGTERIPTKIVQAFNGVYPPDHVVPNNDYFKAAATNPYDALMPGLTFKLDNVDTALVNSASSAMALAGTEPLAEQMGLTQVYSSDGVGGALSATPASKKVYIPFNQGSHVSFVANDESTVFTNMLTQMITFFASSGAALNAGAAGIAAEQTDYDPVQ